MAAWATSAVAGAAGLQRRLGTVIAVAAAAGSSGTAVAVAAAAVAAAQQRDSGAIFCEVNKHIEM